MNKKQREVIGHLVRLRNSPVTGSHKIDGRLFGLCFFIYTINRLEAIGFPPRFSDDRSGGSGSIAITVSTKEGKIMFKFTQKILCIILFMVLCLAAGSAGAAEDLLWPVKPELMCKDWEVDDYTALRDVGDVSIWNTKDHLKVKIVPGDGFKLKEVSIHAVNDPAEFDSLLDKKRKAKDFGL